MTAVSTDTVSTTAARPSGRAAGWVRPKTVFLAALLVVLAVYTDMAFDLEWRTAAGRIGPGFFPRIVGILGLALTLWSLVAAVRAPAVEDEVGGPGLPPEDESAFDRVLGAGAGAVADDEGGGEVGGPDRTHRLLLP